jgi:UDP-N-acetylglucosamine:LPS N-acetylglucosamine transferase
VSAARALADELDATGRCTSRLVDAYVECGRFPVRLFPQLYAEVTRHHARLWALIYHGTSRDADPAIVVGPFLRQGLRRLLIAERPDVVVSALPVVNGLLAEASKPIAARLEVVLTDWHSVHPFWVARGVDHYTASTESSRGDCIRFGAAPESIDVEGIPVRREFRVQRTRQKERIVDLGLDPSKFTILAMVGAEGSPAALSNVSHLAAASLDAQLIVVCGRNEELRRQLERVAAGMPVRALGFVEHVADLMRASDVLITKAGGVTLAEAFCCEIPVVIYDVLAGQEAGNLEYVLRHGAVEHAPSPPELVEIVADLQANPVRRARLIQRGSQLARPQAAPRIARNVLARLDAARAKLGGYREAE